MKTRSKIIFFLIFSLVSVFLVSCGRITRALRGKSYYEKILYMSQSWLSENAGEPTIDISGEWSDNVSMAWGDPVLIQISNTVTGNMSWQRGEPYEVRGVINKNNVYLTLIQNDYLYYTMVLTYHEDKLVGKYFYSYDYFNCKEKGVAVLFYRRKKDKN
ncbi:MAG: hypothetical protein WHS77_09515 [Brevinematales bacterium]